MKTSTEVETKLEVDARGFHTIRTAGKVVACVEQLNVYYDHSWTLADRAATFRVRFSASKAPCVTFKVPKNWVSGRRISKEVDMGLGSLAGSGANRFTLPRRIEVRTLPAEFSSDLLSLGVTHLLRVGWVRNTRYVLQLQGAGIVELDCLKLPGGDAFFEVEIEEENVALHQALVDRIHALVPVAKYSHMSKFERFRAAISSRGAVNCTSEGHVSN
jgi:hypothetical protein